MEDTFIINLETALYANEINNTLGTAMLARSRIYGAFAREVALRQQSQGLILAFSALLAPKEGDFEWRHMKMKIVISMGGLDEIAPSGALDQLGV